MQCNYKTPLLYWAHHSFFRMPLKHWAPSHHTAATAHYWAHLCRRNSIFLYFFGRAFFHIPSTKSSEKPDFFLSFPNWNHVVGKSFVRRNSQCFSHPANFITNAVHHITYSQACKSKTLTAQVYPKYRGGVACVTCCEALGPWMQHRGLRILGNWGSRRNAKDARQESGDRDQRCARPLSNLSCTKPAQNGMTQSFAQDEVAGGCHQDLDVLLGPSSTRSLQHMPWVGQVGRCGSLQSLSF